MLSPDVLHQFEQEMSSAHQARAQGNEGQARVCARRAAGAAIGSFIQLHGLPFEGRSAYDRLAFLSNLPGLPNETYQSISLLMMQVNTDFSLPVDVDLIKEAQCLFETLNYIPLT